jgi:hypothetical protein
MRGRATVHGDMLAEFICSALQPVLHSDCV